MISNVNTSVLWYSSERLVKLCVSLVMSGLIAQKLGVTQQGELTYYLSITTILSVISSFSLELISVSEFSKNKNNEKKLLNLTIFRFITSFLYMIIALAIFHILSLNTTIGLLIASTNIFSVASVYEAYYLNQKKGKYITLTRLSSFFIFIIYKLYIIYYIDQYVLLQIAICTALETMFIFICYALNSRIIFIEKVDFKYIRYIFRKALPLIISSCVIMLYNRIDQVMIANMNNLSDLGIYSISVKISDAYNALLTAILAASIPSVISNKDNHDKFKNRYIKLIRILNIFSLLGVLFVLFLGEQAVYFIFGDEYISSHTSMTILVCAIPFSTMAVASTHWLISDGNEKLRLSRSVFSLILNIVLNFVLIPIWGINGAAVATLISQIYAGIAGYALSSKTRKIFFYHLSSFNLLKRA